MRLDKFVCKSTELTLGDARALIENKRVQVNATVVIIASHQVHKSNTVMIGGEILIPRRSRYLLLNKPAGMICSNVDEVYPSVLNLLDIERVSELHIAGRLDADTTGLVLVTDDGHWSFNLTSPKTQCEKRYKVTLSRPIAYNATEQFLEGVLLQGESKLTLPAELEIVDPYTVFLTVTEGRFHQVKRMFAFIGNRVKSLHRQRIGSVELDVDVGAWRSLTISEVDALSVDDCLLPAEKMSLLSKAY